MFGFVGRIGTLKPVEIIVIDSMSLLCGYSQAIINFNIEQCFRKQSFTSSI